MELYETSPYFYQEPHFYDEGENYLPVHLQGFEPPGCERASRPEPEARVPMKTRGWGRGALPEPVPAVGV